MTQTQTEIKDTFHGTLNGQNCDILKVHIRIYW